MYINQDKTLDLKELYRGQIFAWYVKKNEKMDYLMKLVICKYTKKGKKLCCWLKKLYQGKIKVKKVKKIRDESQYIK